MQQLTAGPRSGYTPAQVTAVLTADSLVVGWGAEVVTGSGPTVVSDVSPALLGGTITYDSTAAVPFTCALDLSQSLAWGAVQVRPYLLLTGAGITRMRFDLGVYVLTNSTDVYGQTPQTWATVGYSRLFFLTQPIGTGYSVPAGGNVLAAVRSLISQSGAPGAVILDSSATSSVTAKAMVWVLDQSNTPTYLQVINELLDVVGYRHLWNDENGNYRAEPFAAPGTRAVDWTHDTRTPHTSLLSTERSGVVDTFPVPNRWVFLQRGLATAPTKNDGSDGRLIVNDMTSVNGQTTLGYTKTKITWLDVTTDLGTLTTQGNRIVATDSLLVRQITAKLSPFPLAQHEDVYTVIDPAAGATVKVVQTKWQLTLGAADMAVTWSVVG